MKRILIVILLALYCNVTHGQEEPSVLETVFLSLDKSYYASGDRIVYHVFVLPDNVEPGAKYYTSNFAYIDFVDPQGTVLQRQKIKLYEGAGKGEISTPGNLGQGYYRIFAYTKSMELWENDEIFSIEVPVYSIYDDPDFKNLDSDRELLTFPEGGIILSERPNRIIYSLYPGVDNATDIKLVDQDQNLIQQFEASDNFGFFEFVPDSGNLYFLLAAGKSFALAPIVDSGISLKVFDDSTVFRVQAISRNVDQKAVINATVDGKTVYSTSMDLLNEPYLRLNKSDLPEGLINFSISQDGKIHSERLVYNKLAEPNINIELQSRSFSKGERIKANVTIENSKYEPLSAVITVTVKTSDEALPKKNNLNLADIYKIRSQTKTDLAIDLDLNKINTMDYLVSRRYNYKEKTPGPIEFSQKIDLAIDPSSPGYSDKLSFISAYFVEESLYTEIRYESGHAILNVPDLGSTNHVWFAGFDTYGIQTGEIMAKDPRDNSFERSYQPLNKILIINNNEVIRYLNGKVKSDVIKQVYGVPARKEINDEIDEPDVYIQPDDYLEESDLRGFIVGVIPRATVKKKKGIENLFLSPSHTASRFKSPPLYFINNIPTYDGSSVLGIDLSSIDHFEIFNSFSTMNQYGIAGRNGIFKIFLKEGVENPIADRVDDLMIVDGLTFSSFSSEGFEKPSGMKYPDFRSLLYTSLPIKTDASGKIIFSFDASDIAGNYKILVEGITEHGKFIYNEFQFAIEVN